MKNRLNILALVLALLAFSGCSGSASDSIALLTNDKTPSQEKSVYLVAQETLTVSGEPYTYEHQYDDNGIRLSYHGMHEDNTQYTFDKNGNLTGSTTTVEIGVFSGRKLLYSLNQDGSISEAEFYYFRDENQQQDALCYYTKNCIYNPDGSINTIEESIREVDFSTGEAGEWTSSITQFAYKKENEKIVGRNAFKDNVYCYHTDYTYMDDSDLLESVRTYNAEDNSLYYEETYQYDTVGNMKKRSSAYYNESNPDGMMKTVIEYEYIQFENVKADDLPGSTKRMLRAIFQGA